MIRLALVCSALLMMGGCASKQEKELMQMYKHHRQYHKTLLKTEKAVFRKSDGATRLSVVATYLPKAGDQKDRASRQEAARLADLFGLFASSSDRVKATEPETFIVGLYGDETDIDHWNASGIAVTLGGKKPLSVKPLDPNDKRLKALSFVTDWGAFYLVRFPHSRAGLMRFDVTFDGEKKPMIFSKRAKYVYTKKAFE